MLGFAWIWLLLLIPLPLIFRRLWASDANENEGALRVPFFDEVAKIANRRGVAVRDSRRFNLIFLFVIWCLLVVAVARPQYAGPAQPVMEKSRNMMLVMDISGSMEETDFKMDGQVRPRIFVVKEVAADFLKKRKGDKIGVVTFGTRSYLYVPITGDVKTAAEMMEELEIGFAGPLTAIGDAIGLAIKSMQNVPATSRVIVLLSDGSANAGVINIQQAIKASKEAGVKVYTIGVGAYEKEVETFFGPQMVNPSTDLDEVTLQKIAKETGGEYFRAYDTKSLNKIYDKIDELEPVEAGQSFVRPVKELFYIPLVLALFLSIFGIFLFIYKTKGRA